MSHSFDLEEALGLWRRKLRGETGLEPGHVAELESHLLDRFQELKRKGLTEEEAFREAAARISNAAALSNEYHKASIPRVESSGRGLWAGFLTLLPSYVKTALRGMRSRGLFAGVNILGLSIGLACCLLIALYVSQQLRYDRFHPDPDNLYRVTFHEQGRGGGADYAVSVPALGPLLYQEQAGVEIYTRLSVPGDHRVRAGDRWYRESMLLHADSTFFRVFGFELRHGNPENALSGGGKAVLSASTARNYFGESNPLGRTITVSYGGQERLVEVSGIAEEPSGPSHIRFDLLVSMETLQEEQPLVSDDNWWLRSVYTYVRTSGEKEADRLRAALPSVVEHHMSGLMERSGSEYAFSLQSVTDIHLRSDLRQELRANGSLLYVYLFGSVAILILLIACFNYMNLSTARFARRAREVGIRKVLGADRGSLVRQFLGESLLYSLAAMVLALVLARAGLPFLEQLAGMTIDTGTYSILWLGGALVGIWLGTGLLAGVYPALFLSSFMPMQALKGSFGRNVSATTLRKVLVTAQFAVTIALLIGAALIYRQLEYVQNKPLGYERERVVVLTNGQGAFESLAARTLREELASHASVRSVAFASHYPTRVLSDNTVVRPAGAPEDARYAVTLNAVSSSYGEVLQLDMTEGRMFDDRLAQDSSAVVINQAAADYFGWQNPVGKSIYSAAGDAIGQVVGVVRDFHVQSLYEQIEPVVLTLGPAGRYEYTLVKAGEGNLAETLAFLEGRWKSLYPDRPFEHVFLSSRYQAQYRSEQRLGHLISFFSILAATVACLGLTGLAAYTAQRRTREIGIRKVLGASVGSIVYMLSGEFLKLVGMAFLVAAPVAWYLGGHWLDSFAYHAEPAYWMIALAGATVAVIALGAVSWQAVRAATADPVRSLRTE